MAKPTPKPTSKPVPVAVVCITCTRDGGRYDAKPGEDMSFLRERDLLRLRQSGAIAMSDG